MADFPGLRAGVVTQLPFTRGHRFETLTDEMEGGTVHTYYNRAAARHFWELQYQAITDTEASALVSFFSSVNGPVGEFRFQDPQTGTWYEHCRFDQDTIEVRYIGPGQCAMTLKIVEL